MHRQSFLLLMASFSLVPLYSQAPDCAEVTYIEWPELDLIVSAEGDSCYRIDQREQLIVRGIPKKRQQVCILRYSLPIEATAATTMYLRLYPTSYAHIGTLSVYQLSSRVADQCGFLTHTADAHLLGRAILNKESLVDVQLDPDQVRDDGTFDLLIRTDSKKSLTFTSTESGLGSQLVLEHCSTSQSWNLFEKPPLGPSMQLTRLQNQNRVNVLLGAMPRAGIAQLIFFDVTDSIVRTMPIQVDGSPLQLLQLDLGTLRFADYRVVLRMGSVVVDDHLTS